MRTATKQIIEPVADLSGVDAIMPDLRAPVLPQIMQAMATQAAADVSLPEGYIFDRLAAQEKHASSGIGNGVAIMHLRLSRLKQPYAVFARAVKPVAVSAVDNLPADLFMLLLSPAGDVSGHLQRLSRFSRLLRDEDFRNKLRVVDGTDGLRALFLLPEGQTIGVVK